MSAIREDIGTKRKGKRSVDMNMEGRPVTAITAFSSNLGPSSPKVPVLPITSPN